MTARCAALDVPRGLDHGRGQIANRCHATRGRLKAPTRVSWVQRVPHDLDAAGCQAFGPGEGRGAATPGRQGEDGTCFCVGDEEPVAVAADRDPDGLSERRPRDDRHGHPAAGRHPEHSRPVRAGSCEVHHRSVRRRRRVHRTPKAPPRVTTSTDWMMPPSSPHPPTSRVVTAPRPHQNAFHLCPQSILCMSPPSSPHTDSWLPSSWIGRSPRPGLEQPPLSRHGVQPSPRRPEWRGAGSPAGCSPSRVPRRRVARPIAPSHKTILVGRSSHGV